MLLDSHCHLDMYQKPEKLLEKSQKSDVFIVGVTLKPSHYKMGLPYIRRYKNIRFALGMHPLYIHEHTEIELDIFNSLYDKTSYIGEIGLDFSKEGVKTKQTQIKCFQKILEKIYQQKKYISLHSRKAEKEVLSMLKDYKIQKGIFHWYTGMKSLIPEIIDEGHFFL